MFEGITVEKALKDGYGDYLKDIKEYLSDKLGGMYTHEDFTNVALKFSIQPPGQSSVDVDLILSPHFLDHHSFLRAMKVVDAKERLKM